MGNSYEQNIKRITYVEALFLIYDLLWFTLTHVYNLHHLRKRQITIPAKYIFK